jgi:hypothetical protein
MNQSKIVLIIHYTVVASLVAYGAFATLQIRRLGDRIGAVEQQFARVHDFKPETIALSR